MIYLSGIIQQLYLIGLKYQPKTVIGHHSFNLRIIAEITLDEDLLIQ